MNLDELVDGWLLHFMSEDPVIYPAASRDQDLARLRDSPEGREMRQEFAIRIGRPWDALARALGKRRNTAVSPDRWWITN